MDNNYQRNSKLLFKKHLSLFIYLKDKKPFHLVSKHILSHTKNKTKHLERCEGKFTKIKAKCSFFLFGMNCSFKNIGCEFSCSCNAKNSRIAPLKPAWLSRFSSHMESVRVQAWIHSCISTRRIIGEEQ